MLRARYPLLAFLTLAVVMVGVTWFTGRNATRTVTNLVELQARQFADIVADVAVTNDVAARDFARRFREFDGIVLDVLVETQTDRLRSRQEFLRKWLTRLRVDRALVVDAEGNIEVDAGVPRRPGQPDATSLERIELANVVKDAAAFAAGDESPADTVDPFRLRRHVFRRFGDAHCLVLIRSERTIREISPDMSLPKLLRQFEDDAAIAYVGIRDTDGRVVAEARGGPASEVRRFTRTFELTQGRFELTVDVNIDAAREVERRGTLMPILIGCALLLAGGVAMALVFRLQHTYLERERALRLRAEQDRRLAALGRLTAGVAHEIKNPLNAVRLSVGRLRKRMAGDAVPILNAIDASVVSITQTVTDFMKLARDPAMTLEPTAPATVLTEAVTQVLPMAKELGCTLEVDAMGGEGEAKVDSARLREALVNLLRNALQAASSRVEARLSMDDAGWRIDVDDDGAGIPPAQRTEVFEFFYTTKDGGTGLGLPLAHRVAEEHGGSLEVSDSPLGGARFTLTLPGTEFA